MCTYIRSSVVLTTQDVLFKDTYIFLLLHVSATRKVSYMRYKQHLGESCNVITTYSWKYSVYVCMFGCRIQDVLFKEAYIFLLLHVWATRKVSYMRYKQHLGESCNVTTTFKKVLCVRMYVRVSCSPSKTFDSKIPICSCSYMSELREKYHICDISSTWERVVM